MKSLTLLAAATAVAAAPQRGGGYGGGGHSGGYGGGYGGGGWNNHGWGKGPWDHPSWKGGHHGYNDTGESKQEAAQRAAAVKEMFEFSWEGYYKYETAIMYGY